MSNIRLNWVAILVAAIASFLFEALWFSVFMNEWLAGIGRTMEWLMSYGHVPSPSVRRRHPLRHHRRYRPQHLHPGPQANTAPAAASSAALSSGLASSPPAGRRNTSSRSAHFRSTPSTLASGSSISCSSAQSSAHGRKNSKPLLESPNLARRIQVKRFGDTAPPDTPSPSTPPIHL